MFDSAYRRANFPVVRPDWLALTREVVLDPDRAIVDAHHHLWDEPSAPYGSTELAADVEAGHRITDTVYIEAKSRFLAMGPEHLRPIGEVAFAASARSSETSARLCSAIVGYADLARGDAVAEVLEAEVEAGQGRFRGVRARAAWHADPNLAPPAESPMPGLLADAGFRCGAKVLARMGLTLDIWVFHTQLAEVTALAGALPELGLVVNHCGGPLGVGPFKGRRSEVFDRWRADLRDVAAQPNCRLKLGGLGMPRIGFTFHEAPEPPDSETLAEAWHPYIDAGIAAFGPSRCMFESNFPVDKGMMSYRVLWNAFKRLTMSYGQEEKQALFSGTAKDFYRI